MQNENLTPNGGANMPANQPQMPPSAAPKKSNRPLLMGLGALGLVVVVGLAVSLSQGDLFKGQLQLRDSAITLSTKNDFSAEVKNLNLDLSQNIGQLSADGRSYNLLVDKRATEAVSFKDKDLDLNSAAYAKTGLGNDLYLKITPVRDTSARDNSSNPASANPVVDTNSFKQEDATRAEVGNNGEVTANTTINATYSTPTENKEFVQADGFSATTTVQGQSEDNGVMRTEVKTTIQPVESDLKAVEVNNSQDQGPTTSSTTTENERNRNNPDGVNSTVDRQEATVSESEDNSTRKLESSLINVAHAAISNEMSCEIDRNFIVKCSDIAEYPDKLYSVSVTNAPELKLNYGLRVSNSSCKDFDGFRFDPATINFNGKDSAYNVKMYAYLGSEEFSVEDICMASLREAGAENGVALTLNEANMAAVFAQSNLQVADMSKEQTLLNGFVTANAGGALKLDLAKTEVGGNINTVKDNTEYSLSVSAGGKTLSPALKIQSLGKVEENTPAPVVVTPGQTTLPGVVVTGTRDNNPMTPVVVTGTRDSNCANLDRLAFSPTALTYTEGEANTVATTTLSGYNRSTDVGIPFDQTICSAAVENLQLEGSGFYVEVVNNSTKQTSTQLLDMSDDALDKMGQKAILEGFNLFNGVVNVKLTQNAEKQIKLAFNNDLSKRDLGKGFTMMAGQEYTVNLKGVRLKDSKAGKVTSNYVEGDKVLAAYSLKINERPAATTSTVTQPTQTTTSTTSTQTPEKPVQVTERSAEPCVVDGRNYYLAEGPNSSYCKDLQGLSTVLKTDQAPETPQVRYTTALAVQRIINEIIAAKDLDARFRVRNVSGTWYNVLVDGNQISTVSSQEMADFKNVYATGILKGRIDPKDNSEVTLAPLDRVTYAELLSILRQAVASVLGVNPTIIENNLPSFLLSDYRENADLKWVAEAVSFGVEYKIIEKDEFNRDTLFAVATRADMASFLTKFREAINKNPALLAR